MKQQRRTRTEDYLAAIESVCTTTGQERAAGPGVPHNHIALDCQSRRVTRTAHLARPIVFFRRPFGRRSQNRDL